MFFGLRVHKPGTIYESPSVHVGFPLQVLNQLSLSHNTTSSSSSHNSQSLTNGHLSQATTQQTAAQSAVQSAVQSAIRNAQSAKINNQSSVSTLSEGLPPSVSQLLPSMCIWYHILWNHHCFYGGPMFGAFVRNPWPWIYIVKNIYTSIWLFIIYLQNRTSYQRNYVPTKLGKFWLTLNSTPHE